MTKTMNSITTTEEIKNGKSSSGLDESMSKCNGGSSSVQSLISPLISKKDDGNNAAGAPSWKYVPGIPSNGTSSKGLVERGKGKKGLGSASTKFVTPRYTPAPLPLPDVQRADESNEDDNDEYAKFVKSLWCSSRNDLPSLPPFKSPPEDDDDDDDIDDDDEEASYHAEDDDDEEFEQMCSLPSAPDESPTALFPSLPSPPSDELSLLSEPDFYNELSAELGGLLEEDLEAAVTTLIQQPLPAHPPSTSPPPTEPPITITSCQLTLLRSLLSTHYQLLLQQAILSIRTAHTLKQQRETRIWKQFYAGSENADDLTEILDGAVGMLQDLDQNRKDAIRTYVQLDKDPDWRRLTRSRFQTLQKHPNKMLTVFDVKGLENLQDTFQMIDHSVDGESLMLDEESHEKACKLVLDSAGAEVREVFIPGARDLMDCLTFPKEVFTDAQKPLPKDHDLQLRKNRNQFTASEDNLLLRGVNLYGEKEWLLISDRFLPDRSISIISQRYARLCYLFYKAHGIYIDDDGNLETPPDHPDGTFDEALIAHFRTVKPPNKYDVHRWSLEEDLTILRAVPIMGNLWAEMSNRLVPHRDRGHLRKRYQVLDRRVKSAIRREKKMKDLEDANHKKREQARFAKLMRCPATAAASKTLKEMFQSPSPTHQLVRPTSKDHQMEPPDNTQTSTSTSLNQPQPPPQLRPPNHKLAISTPHKNGYYIKPSPIQSSEDLLLCSEQINSSNQHHDTALSTPTPSSSSSNNTQLEKLLNEESNWSMMSKVKKLINEDTTITPIEHQQHHPPPSTSNSKLLPHWSTMMESTSSSGLSIFNNTTEEETTTTTTAPSSKQLPKKPNRIMEHVLQQCPPPHTPIGNNSVSGMLMTFSEVGCHTSVPSKMDSNIIRGFTSMEDGTDGGFGNLDLSQIMMSEKSHQALVDHSLLSSSKLPKTTPTATSTTTTPTNNPLNSLMAYDLEAITALNSMSNSPILHPSPTNKKRSSTSQEQTSLFAKVVGGVQEKEAKRQRICDNE